MPRSVRFFDLFWPDREFKKSLRNLGDEERNLRLQELAELAQALISCTHPTHDPALAKWRPSAYHVRRISAGIKLCEYRCRFPFRIIVRWIDPSDEDPEGAVLIVAATLNHDHERLADIIFRNRQDLG